MGKQSKFPFSVHEAMYDLQIRLKIYPPYFNSAELCTQAGEQAARRTLEMSDEFEDIPLGAHLRAANVGSETFAPNTLVFYAEQSSVSFLSL